MQNIVALYNEISEGLKYCVFACTQKDNICLNFVNDELIMVCKSNKPILVDRSLI